MASPESGGVPLELPVSRRRLGEILVSLGFCTGRQVREALREQALAKSAGGNKPRLGHILLQGNVISDRQLSIALATAFETANVDLIDHVVDLSLLARIPAELQLKYGFVPLALDHEGLRIAIDDPPDSDLFDSLEECFSCRIRYLMAPSRQLQRLRSYCLSQRAQGNLEKLAKLVFAEPFFTGSADEADGYVSPAPALSPGAVQGTVVVLAPKELAEAGTAGSASQRPATAPTPWRLTSRYPVLVTPGTVEAEPLAEGALLEAPPEEQPGHPYDPLDASGELSRSGAISRDATLADIPLSRVLSSVPEGLLALLRELKTTDCHSMCIVPHDQGADRMVVDENGSKLVETITPAAYRAILDKCLELVGTAGDVSPRLVRQRIELGIDGQTMIFGLRILPSDPPTLTVSLPQRDSWSGRRQIRQETVLLDGITRRGRQRRGLVLLTGVSSAELSDAMAGILNHVVAERLRVAAFSDEARHRIRRVSHFRVRPDALESSLEPSYLLSICESGIDMLALDIDLPAAVLGRLIPLAAGQAALVARRRDRDTLDAIGALVKSGVGAETLAVTLEMAVSVHAAHRLCPFCRKAVVLAEADIPSVLRGSKLANSVVFTSPGCQLCGNTGTRGSVRLYETLEWDRDKTDARTLLLDRRSLAKRCYELGMLRPMTLSARRALLAGEISFMAYKRLLGVRAS